MSYNEKIFELQNLAKKKTPLIYILVFNTIGTQTLASNSDHFVYTRILVIQGFFGVFPLFTLIFQLHPSLILCNFLKVPDYTKISTNIKKLET